MMTRKHYIMLAKAIKDTANYCGADGIDAGASIFSPAGTLWVMAHELADRLEDDNPLFDRERFLAACIDPASS